MSPIARTRGPAVAGWIGIWVVACKVFLGAAFASEIIEPPALNYPINQYAKVAVLQWTHPEYAPVPATPAQAEQYKTENRRALAEWAETAHGAGAELLVTPEFGVTGYPKTSDGEDQFKSPQEVAPYAESIPGPSTLFFGDLAVRTGMWVQFNLAERAPDGVFYNSSVLMNSDGELAGVYRKRNLFGSERNFLQPGIGTTVVDTPFGRLGLMICADIYHSPSLEAYRRVGVDAMIVSAAWTVANSAIYSFRNLARNLRVPVVASNLADFPDSGVVNADGSLQSHIRETRGLAFGYLPRKGNHSETVR